MLSKLESAVDKISEGNSRIATILAKHDERIEQSIRNDELIVRMIDDLKVENKEDYNSIIKRVESLEKVVDELKKFRWQIAAIVSAALIFVGVIPTIKTLTNLSTTVQIEEIKK
jgi:hypothetical protein